MWQNAALWMPEGTHWDLVFFIEENCSWSRPFLQLQPWLQVHVRSIAGSDFADVEILPQLQKQDMVWSDILFYFYSINLAEKSRSDDQLYFVSRASWHVTNLTGTSFFPLKESGGRANSSVQPYLAFWSPGSAGSQI